MLLILIIIKETQDIMQHNLDIYPPKEDIYKLDTKQLKAVICLLDLYNKEKEGLKTAVSNEVKLTRENTKLRKENYELKIELDKEKEKNKKSEYYEMVADELYKNSISKDKIRNKIEVIQKRIKEETRTDFLITLKILENELQELLEEGDR